MSQPQTDGQSQKNASDEAPRSHRAGEGNPQTDRSPEGASPDRQIAQEPQQSTGQGMGQS